jgi:hypothetical protein
LLKSGDSFLIPKTGGSTEHLWIVLTDPDVDGKSVCVNITTQQNHSETTVVLNKGDHPFVQHASVVYYTDARILDLNLVQQALETKTTMFACVLHKPCSQDLLKRIREGLLKSRQTPKKIKAVCEKSWSAS